VHLQRGAVTVAVALSAVLFVPPLGEPFNAPKLAAILLAAGVAGLAGSGARVSLGAHGRRFGLAVGAFLAVGALATALHPAPLRAVMGLSARSSGYALVLACGLLGWVAVRVHALQPPTWLVGGLVVATAGVMAYGTAQLAGLDPFGWRVLTRGPQLFASFGNNNFFAGWLGSVSALLLCGSLLRTAWWIRLSSAAAWLGAVALVALTTSLQGVAAALAGAAVVGGVRLAQLERPPSRRLLAGGGAVAAAAVAGLAAAGALDGVVAGAARSFHTRVGQWQAAAAMGLDRPLTGVGYDGFVDWVHAYRPLWWALEKGIHPTTDAAHSVPLQLLAGGGVPLLAAYLAVLASTGVALVAGLRALRGNDRLVLAGLGGVWTGYHVQALVSVDVPPLAVLHWVLAGTIVGTAARATTPVAVEPRGRTAAVSLRLAAVAGALAAVAASVAVIGTGVVGGRADRLAGEHRVGEAEAGYERAAAVARWDPQAALDLGRHRSERGDHEGALEAYTAAVARQPRGIIQQVELARLAGRRGDDAVAARAYAAAIRIDPRTPGLRAEAAGHALQIGDVESAVGHLRAAVTAEPAMAAWWEALAAALEAAGDAEGARWAQERAAEADPDLTPPEDGLHERPPGARR
jgi:O-antigen ligase